MPHFRATVDQMVKARHPGPENSVLRSQNCQMLVARGMLEPLPCPNWALEQDLLHLLLLLKKCAWGLPETHL